jgi:uncharacterized damage-inducible protein DinB
MPIDDYRRWFDYEKDCHAKVLASLAAVPPELRSAEAFQKAVDLLAHIVASRRLWLFRFGSAPDGPSEIFPKRMSLEEVRQSVARTEEAWTAYLAGLDERQVAATFEYRSLEGEWYRNTVADILTQLFGHSWYHRGQIAALVRSLGCEPAITDFVFWTREPIVRIQSTNTTS